MTEKHSSQSIDSQSDFSASPGLIAIFAAAYQGLMHTLSVQRNMKVHWIAGYMVMLVGMALDFDLTVRAALVFSVFLMLFAEILNSALEAFVDLHTRQYHYQAKLTKDAAAAGVLVLAVAVVILFADILWHNRVQILASETSIEHTLLFGLPSVVLMAVLLRLRTPVWFKHFVLIADLGLLIPLIVASKDVFFSLMAGLFVVVAYQARVAHPKGQR